MSKEWSADPQSAYALGWRDAIAAAFRCGAYNTEHPPFHYALCIRPSDHTGKHDDGWLPWGDKFATTAQNRADAEAHSRSVRTPDGGR